MRYRKGFSYQLAEQYNFQTDFRPKADLITDFVILRTTGVLELLKGFAWDGVTGAVDRATNFKGGAKHDGLYRLMRKGLLDHNLWHLADLEYAKQLATDGAWQITIWADMKGLAIMKGKYAHPDYKQKICTV